MKKIILVLGATGNQGGAVVRHLLKTDFAIRAITRNPNQLAAKQLAQQGVEVVKADLADEASLLRALQGVDGKRQMSFWLPPVLTSLMGGMGKMFQWFGQAGFQADLKKCRALIRDTLTFEQWLTAQKSNASS